MVSESDTGQRADVPRRGVDYEIPHRLSVREENEVFFIRVCKPLPSKRLLKTSRRALNCFFFSFFSSPLCMLQHLVPINTNKCIYEVKTYVDCRYLEVLKYIIKMC